MILLIKTIYYFRFQWDFSVGKDIAIYCTAVFVTSGFGKYWLIYDIADPVTGMKLIIEF